MQMKPCIPSKEWYICFSSRKKNEYAIDEKLRGVVSTPLWYLGYIGCNF